MLFINNLPPFSQFHSYEIHWGKLGREGQRLNQIQWTEQELDVRINLKRNGVMTQSQLIEGFWGGNKKGRQKIRRMVQYGAIDEHILTRHIELQDGTFQSNEILFYTPRWESKLAEKYKLDLLLQKIIFAQLYLQLKKTLKPIHILPGISSFIGCLLTSSEQIFVAVVKGNTSELQDSLKRNTTNQMIIILEQEAYIKNLQPYIQAPVQWVIESDLTIKTKRLTGNKGRATLYL